MREQQGRHGNAESESNTNTGTQIQMTRTRGMSTMGQIKKINRYQKTILEQLYSDYLRFSHLCKRIVWASGDCRSTKPSPYLRKESGIKVWSDFQIATAVQPQPATPWLNPSRSSPFPLPGDPLFTAKYTAVGKCCASPPVTGALHLQDVSPSLRSTTTRFPTLFNTRHAFPCPTNLL